MKHTIPHGPLTRYVKLRVAHAPGIPGTYSPPPRVSDPDIYHGTCVTHVPWCMPGSLTRSFIWSRWRGKRSRLSRVMRNPQSYVSGKRPIQSIAVWPELCSQDCISKTQFPPYQGRIKRFALASRGTQDQLLPPIYYVLDAQGLNIYNNYHYHYYYHYHYHYLYHYYYHYHYHHHHHYHYRYRYHYGYHYHCCYHHHFCCYWHYYHHHYDNNFYYHHHYHCIITITIIIIITCMLVITWLYLMQMKSSYHNVTNNGYLESVLVQTISYSHTS